MPNRVKCGSCDSVFQVPDGFSGSRGKCPKCGVVVELPGVELPEVKSPPPRRTAATAPPKKRPAAAAAKPPAEPAVRRPPVKDAAHAYSEDAAGSIVTTDSPSGSFTPSVATGRSGSAASSTGTKPYRRRSSFPVWGWVLLGVGGAAAVGLGVYALMGGMGPGDPVASEPSGSSDDGAVVDKPSGGGGDAFIKQKSAKTVKEARDAIVKIEIFSDKGMSSGTGFFIKNKGSENAWVVTNCHVIEGANTTARARTAGGTNHESIKYEIAGVIAKRTDHDLAIIMLAARPASLTLLDIGRDEDIAPETEVNSYGHPEGVDFALTFGVVNRVWTTSQLPESTQEFLAQKKVPADFRWVQHNVVIRPGSSGGPVFIEDDGRIKVVGVNTFINVQADYGYASHVRHLKDLIAGADEKDLEPLPPPKAGTPGSGTADTIPELARVDVRCEKMQQLYDEAVAFDFKPEKAEQYETLAELAKKMTFAKIGQKAPELVEKMPKEELVAAGELAEQLFGKLGEVKFTEGHVKALNKFGAERLEGVWGGMFVCPTVINHSPGQLYLHLGEDKIFLAKVPPDLPEVKAKSKWLILGYVSAGTWQIQVGQDAYRNIRVIDSQMLVEIK
ncbi:MAG: trypsin-like peptidase domain-containing protein [Candidatus Nealsonbacteria bacterium]|nr:trypsin-like peptidase domain-containing protein [Candidatus Nealsonbacteria bacterium]